MIILTVIEVTNGSTVKVIKSNYNVKYLVAVYI